MTWTFIWLMLLLKIPIFGLLWIVWWALHQTDGQTTGGEGDDGGSKVHEHRAPLSRPPRPRGPHAALQPPAPPRIRRATATYYRTLDCPGRAAASQRRAASTRLRWRPGATGAAVCAREDLT